MAATTFIGFMGGTSCKQGGGLVSIGLEGAKANARLSAAIWLGGYGTIAVTPTPREEYMLVHCVAYENGSKLADISVEDISEYIVQPGCFVWVALADATPGELDEMREEFGLHELAVEDARHGHHEPRSRNTAPPCSS
jgi:hypothetical protein